jgi:hypothetical protein
MHYIHSKQATAGFNDTKSKIVFDITPQIGYTFKYEKAQKRPYKIYKG